MNQTENVERRINEMFDENSAKSAPWPAIGNLHACVSCGILQPEGQFSVISFQYFSSQ